MLGKKRRIPKGEWWAVRINQDLGIPVMEKMVGAEKTGEKELLTRGMVEKEKRDGKPIVMMEPEGEEYFETVQSWLRWKRRKF